MHGVSSPLKLSGGGGVGGGGNFFKIKKAFHGGTNIFGKKIHEKIFHERINDQIMPNWGKFGGGKEFHEW